MASFHFCLFVFEFVHLPIAIIGKYNQKCKRFFGKAVALRVLKKVMTITVMTFSVRLIFSFLLTIIST